jgi:hypothetical protein
MLPYDSTRGYFEVILQGFNLESTQWYDLDTVEAAILFLEGIVGLRIIQQIAAQQILLKIVFLRSQPEKKAGEAAAKLLMQHVPKKLTCVGKINTELFLQ